MPCQYCHQPIPKNKLYCPHCGAANPDYDKENILDNDSIIVNNVIVVPPKKAQETVKPYSSTTNKCAGAIKQTIFCTIIVSLILAAVYTTSLNHDVDFWTIFLFMFIGDFFLNLLITFAAKDLGASKLLPVIMCIVTVIIGCIAINNQTDSVNESYSKTHDFSDFSSKSHSSSENHSKSQYSAKDTKTTVKYETLPDKPQDGMTFAQLKKQKWGYKFLYTKCRDFDSLRPNCRYYEVVWYNSNLERIGDGILCCQDEDDDTAILAGFRDYTK